MNASSHCGDRGVVSRTNLSFVATLGGVLYCGNVDSEHGNNSNDNTRVQTIEWAVAVFSAVLSLSLSPQGRRLFSISPSVKPCWQDTRVLPFILHVTSLVTLLLFSRVSLSSFALLRRNKCRIEYQVYNKSFFLSEWKMFTSRSITETFFCFFSNFTDSSQ